MGKFSDFFANIKSPVRKIPFDQRREIIADITESSSPGFDYFLMVILSTSIATLGLITHSPAVIIGAMLVAPLMSPIIGIGLASMIGRRTLLKSALSAVLRGALLAVGLSTLLTVINSYLPFVSLHELPQEIISRTHPSPIDLMIALAGGIAAAYSLTEERLSAALPGVAIATALMPPICTVGIGVALQRWDVAGGAFLLFITNAVTIAFAAAFVFFLRGFNPYPLDNNRKLPPSLQFSALLIVILLIPLTYFSIDFVRQAAEYRTISQLLNEKVNEINNAELVDFTTNQENETISIDMTIRTNNPMKYEQVIALQESIVDSLNQPVALRVNQIFAERLDPLIPPTATNTPSPTITFTPGPSPTRTFTKTVTATFTSTATATSLPTSTITPTSTPAQARVFLTGVPLLRLYQSPGGPVIGTLRSNQLLTVLPEEVVYEYLVWVKVIDEEDRQGWVPKIYVYQLTATPTTTFTNTPPSTVTLTSTP
ncbi:MAG: hypothetical protein CVU41_03360 [Chloroflexi bacterium HGW-Chloroflexi-3]|nr:MAG: hypothetical protein CVU41_03360 [Chloroflexi bacterium HGW-Chloroflexi-3]